VNHMRALCSNGVLCGYLPKKLGPERLDQLVPASCNVENGALSHARR
jgi:hypothetical protein